jgi:DNA mismatch endonuclease (patch repair protein)
MPVHRPAGHRKWAPRGAKVPGVHRGDIMSPEKRSQLMSRIKGKGTGPERLIESCLRSRRLKFDQHRADLPGRPDFVFQGSRVAVFIDGDFWHGWRFPLWEHKLAPKWREKIAANRARDRRKFARLRRQGWRVLRIWEHQIEVDLARCVERIAAAISGAALRQGLA